jgi:AraC-like DNA-binding protein
MRPMPTGIPLIRVVALKPAVRALVELDEPVGWYGELAGIHPTILLQPYALLPLRQAIRFLAVAASAKRHDVGLVAGEHARLDDLGVFGRTLLRAPTFGDALGTWLELSGGWSSGEEWRIERRDDGLRLHHRFTVPLEPGDEPAEHYTVALMLNLARGVAGPTWTPPEVTWQTGPTPAVMESSLFRGTRLAFSRPASTIMFPAELLDRPMPKNAVRTSPYAPDAEGLHMSPLPTDLAGSVREVIVSVTPREAHPRVEHVAAALGMSIRTLQRRLSDRGLSFEHILKKMRLELAGDLLVRTDTRILDVALDLGYSDHAHFTRAFRQWTGVSPFEYRRRRRERASANFARTTARAHPHEGATP